MTPLEFAFASVAVAILLIGATGALVWVLAVWLPRKWRETGQLVDELANLGRYAPSDGRCRWCESLIDDGTLTIDDCDCDKPCDPYKSWCKARRAAMRKGLSQ